MNFGSARTNICAGEALRMMFVSTGYLLIFLPGSAMIWGPLYSICGGPDSQKMYRVVVYAAKQCKLR
jgi:hypothetical protein